MEKEMEVEVLDLDGNQYGVFDEIKNGEFIYVYLANINDEDDVMIRKYKEEDRELILPLDDEAEVEMAANLIKSKYE